MYSIKQKNELALQYLKINRIKCHNFVIFLSIFKKYAVVLSGI